MGAELFHAGRTDGQTDMAKIIVSFLNFAQARKELVNQKHEKLFVIMTPRFPVEIYRSFIFTIYVNFTLKVVTPVFSEVLVSLYKITKHHFAENRVLYIKHRGNLNKSNTKSAALFYSGQWHRIDV